MSFRSHTTSGWLRVFGADSAGAAQIASGTRKIPIGICLFSTVLWTVVTFAVLLPDGLSTRFSYCCGAELFLSSTNHDMQDHFGGSDAGSYARAGELFAATGSELPEGSGPIWSPGMAWVHGLVLLVVGEHGPAVFGLVLINGLAWAALCVGFALLCYRATGQYAALAAPAAFFIFPATRDYLLGIGLFYSETLSIALFGCALLLVWWASLARSWKIAAGAGLAFASAAYVRATFEVIMHPVAAVAVALTVIALLLHVVLNRRRTAEPASPARARLLLIKGNLAASLRLIFAALLVFYALTIPYRLFNLHRFHQASWAFTDYYFAYPWMPDSEYQPVQTFVLEGGGNIACHIAVEQCEAFAERREEGGQYAVPYAEYKSALIRTFATHPFEWLLRERPYFSKYWFARPTLGVPDRFAVWAGVVALALVLISLLGGAALLVYWGIVWPAVLLYGACGGFLVIWSLFHVEVRYFYPVKVLSPLMAMIALSPLWRIYAFGEQSPRPSR